MRRVLLTGGRAPATLDLARMLYRAGCEVIVAESTRFPICRGSRAISELIHVPSPRENHNAFAESLGNVMSARDIDMLIPSCEEVFYIARHREELAAHGDVFCDTFENLERLHNKWTFSQTGAVASVKTPETDLIVGLEDLAASSALAPQSVYKPVYSRFAGRTIHSPSASDLTRIRPTRAFPWIRQYRIVGEEYCSYGIAHAGRLTLNVTYRPAHRLYRGASYYFDPIHDDEINHYVTAFVADRSYTGHVGFDFIRDQEGFLYVIECNPRLTSGVHLISDAGTISKALLNGEFCAVSANHLHPKMVGLAMILFGFPTALGRGQLAKAIHDFRRAGDVVCVSEDTYPALGQFISLAHYLYHGLRLGISPKDASTRDIEWDGEPLN